MKGGRRMKKAGDRWPFQTMRNSRDKGSARARAALRTDIAAPGKKRVNVEERREMANKEERAKRREGESPLFEGEGSAGSRKCNERG